MTEQEKALFRDLNMNPVFTQFCRNVESHKKSLKWKKDSNPGEWPYNTGFGDGIEFVLKSMGYDSGR